MSAPHTFFMTGSASGIGCCITDLLIQKGHCVFATDINLPALEEHANRREWPADRAKLCLLDVRDPDEWARVFRKATAEFDHIDVSMNVPGVMRAYWVHEMPTADVHLQVDVNIKGVIFGTQTAARHMMERRAGHIINFGSLMGLLPVPGMSVYSGSKYAVRGYTLSAARELKRHGVYVTLVCPDAVNTPLFHVPHIHDEEAALAFAGPRMLNVEEVARVVLDKVLVKKPEMICIPPNRGRQAQFAEAFPRIANLFLPLAAKRGRAEQERRRKAGQ